MLICLVFGDNYVTPSASQRLIEYPNEFALVDERIVPGFGVRTEGIELFSKTQWTGCYLEPCEDSEPYQTQYDGSVDLIENNSEIHWKRKS